MSIGRPAALALFRDWLARRVLVRIEVSLALVAFAVDLPLVEVSEDELRFRNADRSAEVVVRLREDFDFRYVDMRLHGQPDKGLVQFLAVFPPHGGDIESADRVAFAELASPVAH